MSSDLKYIVWWWLILLITGSLSLPLIFSFFRKFWDRGYIFSKIISLSVITYLTFIYGVFKVMAFTNQTIVFTCLIILVADIIYLSRKGNWNIFKDIIAKNWPTFLAEELLFLVIFTLWSFVRGFAPDIEGLEKFMDWGFINSALRSTYLPPQDMWFAGETINYYYFGHLMFALLTKLTSISSAVTYNLSIATIAGLTFVSGFSLASNMAFAWIDHQKEKYSSLRPAILVGIISALLLTFGGNLHAVYKIAKIDIQNEGKLVLTKEALTKATSTYWYPDATRFIGFDPDIKDKTIHEFPIYSFVVADLHGHMNDIPVVIGIMAFLFAVILSFDLKDSPYRPRWVLVLPLSWALSVAFMTNAWDFAVYGLLFGCLSFFYLLARKDIFFALISTLVNGLLVVAFWYIFTLPFSLNFIPMTEGVRISDGHSPFWQLFVLYGGFWLMALPFFVRTLIRLVRRLKVDTADLFALGLLLTGTILIIIPEIIYIKDIYIYEHRRANTMFKLVYQAFMMYSLASGFAYFRTLQFLKNVYAKNIYRLIFLLVFVSHLIYPYFAIKSFYGLKDYKGLWGLNWLQNTYPDNLSAIEWLNQNVSGQPHIIEAVGDSYTTYDQVSVATGLPTVQGWVVHEWLWRGGYDKPAARQTDVDNFYQAVSQDPKAIDTLKYAQAKEVLQKYNVKYIIAGAKEYEKYPKLNINQLNEIGAKQVAVFGDTKIYQVE